MSNLRIWDKLGRTDPAQTKQFQRSGGFKGTAIKPMWSNLRMTEMFGPCGLGWGMDKPSFETHQAGEELLVFCTVGIWYNETGSNPSQMVYGVGGDKFYIKQKEGMRSSDEAFKAAYTDALGNAMKLIGVAADVHMGMFDDSKYVNAMQEEFHPQPGSKAAIAAPVPLPAPVNAWGYDDGHLLCRPSSVAMRVTKDVKKESFMVVKLNGKCEGSEFAFCWHKSMFDVLATAKDRVSEFVVELKGDYLNIIDVVSVAGTEYRDGKVFVPAELVIPPDIAAMFTETVP
jgi:hypothetical protein